MPLYEHVFIARQDVSSTQVDSITDQLTEALKEKGGSVANKEYWGLRNLAYRIKKNRKGHYVMLNVEAPADAIAELERQERIHDDVLRYLTIRVDEFEEGPSVIMQGKSGRGRRDDDEEKGGRRGERGKAEGQSGRKDREKSGDSEETKGGEADAKGREADAKADAKAEASASADEEKGE